MLRGVALPASLGRTGHQVQDPQRDCIEPLACQRCWRIRGSVSDPAEPGALRAGRLWIGDFPSMGRVGAYCGSLFPWRPH